MSSSGTKKAAQQQAEEMRKQAELQKAQMLDQAQSNVAQMQQESAQRVAQAQATEMEKTAAEGTTEEVDINVGDSSTQEDTETARKRRSRFFSSSSGANF